MNIETVVETIVDEVARKLEKPIPLTVDLWSPKEVARFLKVSPRQVVERYASRPDFPQPARLPSKGNRGHLRWKAIDVIRWADKLFHG